MLATFSKCAARRSLHSDYVRTGNAAVARGQVRVSFLCLDDEVRKVRVVVGVSGAATCPAGQPELQLNFICIGN